MLFLINKSNKSVINKGIVLMGIMLLLISGLVFTGQSAQAAVCDGNIAGKSDPELEEILKVCEAEIKAQEVVLNGQKNQSASLTRDISVLRSRIDAAKKKVNQKDVEIKKISKDIKSKTETITSLNSDIEKGKESLGQLIRKTNEMDRITFAHAMLGADSISDFYADIDTFSSVKRSVSNSVEQIKNVRERTEGVKKELETKQDEEMDAKAEIEKQKALVEASEKEQKTLLSISKNKEAEYAQVLKDRQAQASKIRAELFRFRGAGPIPFGEAYDMAKLAGSKSGVRPAFILAILKQESNLGANVGTCNRVGDARTWKDIMPGPTSGSWRDDQSAFLRITERLGIKPDGQPLSCPLAIGGWGGAMGPSQFIPATWESYDQRIEAALGVSVANPWNPQHAITATSLYLMDLGAGAKTYTAEREAACKYYSGRGCSAPGVTNAFYGNAVMGHVATIQANIDILEGI
jgi:peptidoglycan hydrolase CwlO-like protein